MQVHTDINDFRGVHRPVLTTGTFDGVHLGHRTILSRLRELARREGGESVLFTFHPHPRMVLFPGDTDLKLLNTVEEKTALLEAAGLDHLLVVPFSRAFSQMQADDYVRELLVEKIGVHAVVIGYDHRFGRDRVGDLALLKRMGGQHGFLVEEIPAQEVDHTKVSSTKVRHALQLGDVRAAAELSGYDYPLSGIVVKGDQLGRTLGYPTANLGLLDPHKLVPADGVYAVRVELRSGTYGGMLYIGHRPTLDGGHGQRTVEVNVFDLDRDLYGEAISVRFLEHIRGDMRFEGLDALREQLGRDRTSALQILNAER
jgi:riboflavin kinase/FMN adenylyltransferase